MKKITIPDIKSLISKNEAFIHFKKEFISRLNQFCTYPEAIDITVVGSLEFKILTCRKGDPDDLNEEKVYMGINNRYLISLHFQKAKGYYNELLSNICRYIADYLNNNVEDLQYNWKDLVSIQMTYPVEAEYGFYDNHFVVWDDKTVAIWHTEQECGEGWITAPRNFKEISEAQFSEIYKTY